jgi:hypothetical protein
MFANRDQEVGAAGTAICDRHHTPVESLNSLAGPLWIIERKRHHSVWRRAAGSDVGPLINALRVFEL